MAKLLNNSHTLDDSQRQLIIVSVLVAILHIIAVYGLVTFLSTITVHQLQKNSKNTTITPITLAIEQTYITNKTNTPNELSHTKNTADSLFYTDTEISSLVELNAIYLNDYDYQDLDTYSYHQNTKQLDHTDVLVNTDINHNLINNNVVNNNPDDMLAAVNKAPITNKPNPLKKPLEMPINNLHAIKDLNSVDSLQVQATPEEMQPKNTTTTVLTPSNSSLTTTEIPVNAKNENTPFFTEYAKNKSMHSLTLDELNVDKQPRIKVAMVLSNEQVRNYLLNPLPIGLTDSSQLSIKSDILKKLLTSINSDTEKRVVQLSFFIDKNGKVMLNPAPRIEKSSGNIYIDNDAVTKISQAEFKPFTVSNQSVNVYAEIRLVY